LFIYYTSIPIGTEV